MKVSYEIPKSTVVATLLFVVGAFLLAGGFGIFYRCRHASALTELGREGCREGSYVSGEIDACLTKKVPFAAFDKYSGESGVFMTGGKSYRFYTVPVADGGYIQIMIWKKETVEAVGELIEGERETVPFVGVIAEQPQTSILGWYEDIPGFRTDALIQEYVLREIDRTGAKNRMIIGGIVLFLAVLLYWQSGGVGKRVLEPERFDKIERYYAGSYNKENELELERKRMRRYLGQKKSLKRWCIAGVVCLILGIWLTVTSHYFEGKLAGVLLVLFALKKIKEWLIHSGLTISVKLAGLFEKRTLQDDIEDCELRIAILEDMLDGGKRI